MSPANSLAPARLLHLILFACLIITGLLAPLAALGAAPGTTGAAAIESARKSVAAATLDDAQQGLALAQLDAASGDETAADDFAKQLAALRAEAAAQPARMDQLRRGLELDRERELAEWSRRLPSNADAETLERVLEQERSIIAGLTAQIDAVAGELALILSGPLQAGDLATLRQRMEELSVPLPRLDDEAAVLAEVRRVRRASELRRTQAELELRLLEQETATRRQRLHELTISELRHRHGLHVRRAELLQAEIADLGRREIDSLIERLAAREEALTGAVGVLGQTVTKNLALGNELIRQNDLLAADRKALAANESAKDRIAIALRDSRARLEFSGSNEEVGRWLWSERRRLETPSQLQPRLNNLRGELARTRLQLVNLNDDQLALIDVPAAARALEDGARDPDEALGEPLATEALEPLLRERIELLTLLQPLLQRRIAALEQSEQALVVQIEDSRELQQLLDRHLLWISSHASVGGAWLKTVPEGLHDLIKPSRYATTLELVRVSVRESPIPWIASLIVLIVLIELRRRAPGLIDAQAPITRQIRRDTYWATARTLGWTLIAALPAPGALYLLGRLLQSAGEPGRFTDSLGGALVAVALPLFAVQVLRWCAIERGLGHAHFRWLRSRREALRQWVPRTALIVLPMYFVAVLAVYRTLELPVDVQARIAIVIAALALAWGIWQMLAAGRVWATRGADAEPLRLRKIMRVALSLAPLYVAVVAMTGYVYTAGVLMRGLLVTLTMTVAVTIVVGLLGRWFLLGERRLAWRRLEERRALAQASEERGEEAPEPEAEITLEQVSAQTSRLLRALRMTLIAGGLIWVWADVLPAIARLDEIAVWHFTETGPDGTTLQQPVTLMAMLLGAFALVLTTIGAKNLPGLIEIGLLSKTQIDAASRYAITSILRYVIVIAGTIIGVGWLGLRWSQLQWMAAALTVGLGFGLQEIFANFVSGLILLFERPFRVGDIITVGDLSGRVTRIRTRATTILDFDNKEIVVPNKSFITGQLINWTLSDTTTRVTIKVGVDYGTDPHKVLALLRQAAQENPLVLADPEPKAWFLTFGANSLDFELYVFVANVVDRLFTRNALNTRITELFSEHEINIAFPQLDVHIREVPADLQLFQPPPAKA